MFKSKGLSKSFFLISLSLIFMSSAVQAQNRFKLITYNDSFENNYNLGDLDIKIFQNDKIKVPNYKNLKFIILDSPKYGVLGLSKNFLISPQQKITYSHLRPSLNDSFRYKVCYFGHSKTVCSTPSKVKIHFKKNDFSSIIQPYFYPDTVLNVFRKTSNKYVLFYPSFQMDKRFHSVINIKYPIRLVILKAPKYGKIIERMKVLPDLPSKPKVSKIVYYYKLTTDNPNIKNDLIIGGFKDAKNNWVSDFFKIKVDILDVGEDGKIYSSTKKLANPFKINYKNRLIKKDVFYIK